MIGLALYQPDIPQNAGTMLRLCACLGAEAHLIEPAGFDTSDRNFRRAGMDYLEHVTLFRHRSWDDFSAWRQNSGRRLVLLTTRGATPYPDFVFRETDILLVGRETSGVPDAVHADADARLVVPLKAGLRSLNVAISAAMVMGEAMRQTGGFDKPPMATAAVDR
jgi:tRNA (cytidine/uridine-2'-O-)-methyltransferase